MSISGKALAARDAGPPAQANNGGDIIDAVITKGDLALLTAVERTRYYVDVCQSCGLNPLTKPFEYITLNGKMVLYALRSCTDQLRSIHGVSVQELSENEREGVYIVTAKVGNRDGRTDMAKGAVNINGLKGDNLANAIMKAETKAKRRATLSLCGLGFLDETEIETIQPATSNDTAARKRPPAPGEIVPKLGPPTPPPPATRDESAAQQFIAATRDYIRKATDGKALADWWKSQEQSDARRSHKLKNEEVGPLKDFVIQKCNQLAGDPGPIPEHLRRAKAPQPQMPPPDVDRDAFLTAMSDVFVKCKSMDELNEAWVTHVDPVEERILQSDRTELAEMFGKRQRQLEVEP
jgi:hypothetical protein